MKEETFASRHSFDAVPTIVSLLPDATRVSYRIVPPLPKTARGKVSISCHGRVPLCRHGRAHSLLMLIRDEIAEARMMLEHLGEAH